MGSVELGRRIEIGAAQPSGGKRGSISRASGGLGSQLPVLEREHSPDALNPKNYFPFHPLERFSLQIALSRLGPQST